MDPGSWSVSVMQALVERLERREARIGLVGEGIRIPAFGEFQT